MLFFSNSTDIPHDSAFPDLKTSTDLEELALIERVREGDYHAFNTLVKRYRERLLGMVYHMIANSTDALDLTQEIFIQAFQAIDNFKGKSSFFTWLYRIGVNKTLEYIRHHKRRKFFSLQAIDENTLNEDFSRSISISDNAEKNAYLRELQEKLNEALQKLSNKHRMAIVLYEIEGLSHSEIATVLKCSEGTVRSRLHYAKSQLKEFLKEYAS